MAEIRSYRDLHAWQRAFDVGVRIYEVTRHMPTDERFGLVSQLRRGAVGVASNIAEGYGRQSTADYVRFLRVSRGCLYELETQMLFAVEFGYIDRSTCDDVLARLSECGRLLAGLIRSLER